MNKTELIAAVAEKAGLTKKDVEKATVPAFKAGKAFKDAVNVAPAKIHKK